LAFVKGQVANPLGRPKGAVGKLTRTVREAFEEAFEELQKDPTARHALAPWAKKNPDKFYLLAQKLIPTQVQAQVEDVTELPPVERAARLAAITARLASRGEAPTDDGSDLA